MPLTTVTEDAAFKCTQCGHVIEVRKGQLLPPCTRCGGAMEKHAGPRVQSDRKTC